MHRSDSIFRESFYHIVVNVYVQGLAGRRRIGYLRFHPLDFWNATPASWDRPQTRWYRIEGIQDSAGTGFVPVAVPGFLLMNIKFGRYVDAKAPLNLADASTSSSSISNAIQSGGGYLGSASSDIAADQGTDNNGKISDIGTLNNKEFSRSFQKPAPTWAEVVAKSYVYDLYIHVYQGANIMCPLDMLPPNTFVEVDLNGRLALNLTHQQDKFVNTQQSKTIERRHGLQASGNQSGTGSGHGLKSSNEENTGEIKGNEHDDNEKPNNNDGDSLLFRSTIKSREVNPVWYETLCIRDVLNTDTSLVHGLAQTGSESNYTNGAGDDINNQKKQFKKQKYK